MHRQSYTTFFSLEFTSQNRSWYGDIFPDTKRWVSLDSLHWHFCSFVDTRHIHIYPATTDTHPPPSVVLLSPSRFPSHSLTCLVVVRERTRDEKVIISFFQGISVCVSLNSLTKFQAEERDTRYLSRMEGRREKRNDSNSTQAFSNSTQAFSNSTQAFSRSPPAFRLSLFLWRGMSSAPLFFPFFFQNGQRCFHSRLHFVASMTGDLQHGIYTLVCFKVAKLSNIQAGMCLPWCPLQSNPFPLV